MPYTPSTQNVIQQLAGLLGTEQVSSRERSFIQTLVRYRDENRVGDLSDAQVEWMLDLHGRHFA